MIKNTQDKGPSKIEGDTKANPLLDKANTTLDNMSDDEKQIVLNNGDSKLLAIYSLCSPLRFKSPADSKRTWGKKELADMILKVLET